MARDSGGGVRVEGLAKATRQLQQLGLDIEDLKDATAAIAAEGADEIRQFVPVGETGALKDDVRGNRAKNKASVISGRARLAYAGPINYGWPSRNIAPAEYMQKGDQVMQPIALTRWEEEIEHHIRRRGLQ